MASLENDETQNTSNPALDNEIYDEIFDKQDRTGVIAAVIDATILGIGVIIALVWQFSLVSHPAQSSATNWQSSPFQTAASQTSSSVTQSTSNAPTKENVAICQAFIKTTFKNGQTHYVEFRGNCSSIRAIAKNSTSTVRLLPARHYNVALTGN